VDDTNIEIATYKRIPFKNLIIPLVAKISSITENKILVTIKIIITISLWKKLDNDRREIIS